MSHKAKPSISIIIAVFNGADTLSLCLNSIKMQNMINKEVIVMDAGSNDGTQEILKLHSDTIDYWESKPDRGIAHAWNKALLIAKGDWILFLGADDQLFDENVLIDFSRHFEANQTEDLIYGKIIFNNGKLDGKILGEEFFWSVYKRRMSFPHTSCFQKRELFERIGMFDETFKIAVDYEIFLRCQNLRAKFIDRFVTKMGGEGLSSKKTVLSLTESRRAQIKNHVNDRWKIELWYFIYRLRHALNN